MAPGWILACAVLPSQDRLRARQASLRDGARDVPGDWAHEVDATVIIE